MVNDLIEDAASGVEDETGWQLVKVQYIGILTLLSFRHELYDDTFTIPTVLTQYSPEQVDELQEHLIESLIKAEAAIYM